VTLTTPNVRRLGVVALAIVAAVALLVAPATPGRADPAGSGSGTDDEGAPMSLRDQLDVAARAYNDAKALLEGSQKRQADLVLQISLTQERLSVLTTQIGPVAAAAYRGSRLSTFAAMLNSPSPQAMLETATTIDYLARQDDAQLRTLRETRELLANQKLQLENEIKLQQTQLAEMEKRRNDAAKALAAYGSGAAGGFVAGAPTAKPAPRNPDGSWPRETCSMNDPTTSGCITPRTLHALQEARLAGFTRYTACWRQQAWGEHPKGRACDFSASVSGFGGVARGSDKTYGDRLAGWLMANASRLGVLYIIWYKQIWFPGLGWRSYRGDGTPSGDHYNHVHLSEQ
jgi:hypothetical protein